MTRGGTGHDTELAVWFGRCEVWDRDRLTGNDFIGEFSVPLVKLMDGRFHTIKRTLADPQGRRGQGVRTQGEVVLELNFAS